MSDLSRFSISTENDLLKNFDQLLTKQGYSNRSEAFRDLMRDALIKSKIEDSPQTGEVLGTLTLVYDHHASELSDKMNGLQHQYYNLIVSVLHVHINHDDCMEVIVLRGEIGHVRSVSESLLTLRGVKHGKLFVTLPAQEIVKRKIDSHVHKHPHKPNNGKKSSRI
jgi:CopG family nickel-responsive transcriptional regulator